MSLIALIEFADNLHPNGKGEDHIIDDTMFSVRVSHDAKGTFVRIFEEEKSVEVKRYPFFVASLDAALRIARRRLIKYICETRGGSPSEIAYAKNRVQQAELELFPEFFMKEVEDG